jgi:hypothetical protein
MGMKKILLAGGHLGIGISLALQEEMQKKECHKTDAEKKIEILYKMRSRIHDGIIEEYILIKRKQSDLPRAKRDKVVFEINRFKRQGILTQEELDFISSE